MAADAMAPQVARSSAAMVFSMLDKEVLVINEGGFWLPVPS